ncbi:MAG: hypothetical protein COA78_25285 [Blastopirellula sp.]|nr:MAG: hypothetical protein COA78_25285 [Blastopirellula sp.]
MANSFKSNFTRKLAEAVLDPFDSERVLSKNVNTQLLAGQFNANSGSNVDFKRPTDYVTSRTSDGDISGGTASPIITGKATGTVQDYITVELDYFEAAEALEMGTDKSRFFKDAAKRVVTDLEVDFAGFMRKNSGLLAGTVGTAVTSWSDVATAGATAVSAGVPSDGNLNYAVNPFTQATLADVQRSLGAVDPLVSEAHKEAIISNNFAGMKVMTATTLSSYTTSSVADRVGAIATNPDVTYATAKDTMTQTIAVNAFGNNLVVKAGDILQITGRNRLNMNTRQPMINAAGSNVVFTGVVTADVTLSGTGTGNIVISGPAIYEAAGAYNTVASAPVATDVVTLLGAASTLYQPNLFWHKQAFSIGSVPILKLNSTDTLATTEDGMQLRVSMGSSIRENKQIVRIDLRPAYAVLNPFFAGQAWG